MSDDCRCIRGTGIDSADIYATCRVACLEKKGPSRLRAKPKAEPTGQKEKSAIERWNEFLATHGMLRMSKALERCAKRFGQTACNR